MEAEGRNGREGQKREQNTRPDTKEPGTRRLKIVGDDLLAGGPLLINIGNFMSGNPGGRWQYGADDLAGQLAGGAKDGSVLPRRLRYQARPWPGSL